MNKPPRNDFEFFTKEELNFVTQLNNYTNAAPKNAEI